MRVAITILVIISIIASLGLGIFWITDYNSAKAQLDEITASGDDLGMGDVLKAELDNYKSRKDCGYFVIGGGVLSLIALIMLKKLKKISAIIFLLSAIVPAVVLPDSLMGTFLFIIGGILAFFYKPKAQTPPPTAAV